MGKLDLSGINLSWFINADPSVGIGYSASLTNIQNALLQGSKLVF